MLFVRRPYVLSEQEAVRWMREHATTLATLSAVQRVEVSTDGGATWADAELEAPLGDRAWRGWSFAWDAPPGRHVLCSRATDAAGNAQPVEPPWNLKGYVNNGVERIPVTVR